MISKVIHVISQWKYAHEAFINSLGNGLNIRGMNVRIKVTQDVSVHKKHVEMNSSHTKNEMWLSKKDPNILAVPCA